MKLRITRVFFAWYDMWVGSFWDIENEIMYVCPLPCIVFQVEESDKETKMFKDWKESQRLRVLYEEMSIMSEFISQFTAASWMISVTRYKDARNLFIGTAHTVDKWKQKIVVRELNMRYEVLDYACQRVLSDIEEAAKHDDAAGRIMGDLIGLW